MNDPIVSAQPPAHVYDPYRLCLVPAGSHYWHQGQFTLSPECPRSEVVHPAVLWEVLVRADFVPVVGIGGSAEGLQQGQGLEGAF